MLQTKRASAEESEKLVKEEAALDHFTHINSTYQMESPLQYHGACGGKAGPAIVTVFDALWIAFILYLEFQAIYCIAMLDFGRVKDIAENYVGVPNINATTVNVQPVLTRVGWIGLLSAADGMAFGWLLWAIIVASSNCQAILAYRHNSSDAKELPFPPLKMSVWWSFFVFLLWSIALGAAVYYYYYFLDKYGQIENLAGFFALMFLILLFGIFTTVLGVCRQTRATWDSCLRCCKSPCHDC